MDITRHSDHILTIDQFWSHEKCQLFIDRSEKIGYEEATIQTDFGPRRVAHVRNNQRVIIDDLGLATELWEVLVSIAPSKVGNSLAAGLNERFRFYKYEPGQEFKKHRDKSFIRTDREAAITL